MKYLITYDITDHKRLKRVHKTLLGFGLPLQYSLFFVDVAPDEFTEIWQKIASTIDPNEDDVRAYPISSLDYEQWQKINSTGIHSKMIIIG